MTRRTRIPWWAELPLVAVSVATVFGFLRVYVGWGFLTTLLAFALGAHATAIACRRLRAPAPLVVLAAVAGAGLAVAWILFPRPRRSGCRRRRRGAPRPSRCASPASSTRR